MTDIREGIEQKLQAVCKSKVGIGCPYSYDCEDHDCFTEDTLNFIRFLNDNGVVRKVERELFQAPLEIIDAMIEQKLYRSVYSLATEDMLKAGYTLTEKL